MCMVSSMFQYRGCWCHCMLWACCHEWLWLSPTVKDHSSPGCREISSWRMAVGWCCPAPQSPPSGSDCGCPICWWAWRQQIPRPHLSMTAWMTPWCYWRSAHQSLSHRLLSRPQCCGSFWFPSCGHSFICPPKPQCLIQSEVLVLAQQVLLEVTVPDAGDDQFHQSVICLCRSECKLKLAAVGKVVEWLLGFLAIHH